mmetsp:Transcript_22826/g.58225  ORF Transcript_22826/g.58225 Transcript_22826/m.58225 type:complete len:221 (+) Transcript_22826:82-744(+)
MWHSLAADNVNALLEAVAAVQILEQVEEGLLLALEEDGGVVAPGLDGAHRNAQGEQGLAEVVRLDGDAQPVRALSQRLEGARGGVQAVVARVRLRVEAEVLPVLEDGVAQGLRVGRLGVRAAEDLAAEVGPGHAVGVPLDLVEVDGFARHGKLRAHPGVEAVDDVDAVNLAAVEATAKLQEGLPLLERIVLVTKAVHAAAQLCGAVHQVVNKPLLQRLVP